MELKWLEDMLLLLETGSFSKAARRRNVTQPAFSRRIRSLETWLGAELVDRSRNPLRFTKSARANEAEIRQIVNSFYELRSRMRAAARAEHPVVFTAQHTLTITHLPRMLRLVEELRPRISYRVRSANQDDCVTHMVRGEAEFLLCYESPAVENTRPPIAVRRAAIGPESLVPVTGGDDRKRPIHAPRKGSTLPLLLYPGDVFLGRLQRTEQLPALMKTFNVETICESAFSAGLKEMALNGMGVAWLPAGLIGAELKSGQLHSLEKQLGRCPMEVVLYATANASSADSERGLADPAESAWRRAAGKSAGARIRLAAAAIYPFIPPCRETRAARPPPRRKDRQPEYAPPKRPRRHRRTRARRWKSCPNSTT